MPGNLDADEINVNEIIDDDNVINEEEEYNDFREDNNDYKK